VKSKTGIPVITIDGASGTGKGVVTHRIAKQLGWRLLDSGVLYRVLGYGALKHHVSLEDADALTKLAANLEVEFISHCTSAPPQIIFENENITQTIRTEIIGDTASKVGTFPTVRAALLDRQRHFRQMPGLVTDGRDMGTVVFPDAMLKIFLRASPTERAKRRHNQLKEMGFHANLSDLVEELKIRDKRDQERVVAPLRPAEDAICIDTDHLSIEQVVDLINIEIQKRL